MKFTSAILAAAVATVAAAPCDQGTLLTSFGTVMLSAEHTACQEASGFTLINLATGVVPTAEQGKKMATNADCKALYANMQKVAATITPSCTIAGVEMSAIATTPLEKVLAAFANGGKTDAATTAPAGKTDAATTAPAGKPANTTAPADITKPTATPTPTPTPAPTTKASSATSAGVAVAAFALTAVAALH